MNILNQPTITAISTPPGTGGIGVIRITGEKSFNIGIKLFQGKKGGEPYFLEKPLLKNRYLYYGNIIDPRDKSIIDEVLIVFMKGPASYTGEDVVEIQAHSGNYVLKKILSLVIKEGAAPADAGEFTKRAFLNGRIGLTQAEAVIDLISSNSTASHKMAVSMSQGELGDKILLIQNQLVEIEASITACVDFPEDVEDILDINLFNGKLDEILSTLHFLKNNHDNGHQLREGLKISIVGPPNAGKSSLLNRLISKDRSIVTSVPGTTRDVIEESLNLNGFPLVLSDTAGIRETEDEVEKIGVLKSRQALESSDLVLFLIDGSNNATDQTKDLFNEVKKLPYLFVVNKNDLQIKKDRFMDIFNLEKQPVYISALKNAGLEDLKKEIFIFFEDRFSSLASSIIPNQRQYRLIIEIIDLLTKAREDINLNLEFELISFDLRASIDLISEILGESISPDILDNLFSNFCIGK